MLVRIAAAADVVAIRALMSEVDELHRDALPWLLKKAAGPEPPDGIEEFVRQPDHVALVAEVSGGALAGALLVRMREPKPLSIVRPARIAELDALAVGRAFQRRGIGTALVRAALDWAREHGATRSELGVYEFNEPARAFWASVGFQTLSRRMVVKLGGGEAT